MRWYCRNTHALSESLLQCRDPENWLWFLHWRSVNTSLDKRQERGSQTLLGRLFQRLMWKGPSVDFDTLGSASWAFCDLNGQNLVRQKTDQECSYYMHADVNLNAKGRMKTLVNPDRSKHNTVFPSFHSRRWAFIIADTIDWVLPSGTCYIHIVELLKACIRWYKSKRCNKDQTDVTPVPQNTMKTLEQVKLEPLLSMYRNEVTGEVILREGQRSNQEKSILNVWWTHLKNTGLICFFFLRLHSHCRQSFWFWFI